jgi:hypothetical protein
MHIGMPHQVSLHSDISAGSLEQNFVGVREVVPAEVEV